MGLRQPKPERPQRELTELVRVVRIVTQHKSVELEQLQIGVPPVAHERLLTLAVVAPRSPHEMSFLEDGVATPLAKVLRPALL